MNSVVCWLLIVVYVGSTAMYAYEYANVNAPFHMNYAHFVSYPTNYTMEIHNIKQILMLMALQHRQMAGLVSMVMWILYIYDIRDYYKTIDIYLDLNTLSNQLHFWTYFRYFSSDDFSLNGIPDKNSIISVVNNGDKMPIHSIPWMTLIEITNIPHQISISPK